MRADRPRVLIVDDQPANVEILAEALGDDYELFAATVADRALELAAGGIDLVLLDVVMPERSGFEVCRSLKANAATRDIPVIFVTALGEVEDEARGFEAGGVDYITKPISPPTVRARVRTHLELRGALRRLEREAEVLAENLRLKEHVERLSRHDLKTPLTSVIAIPQLLQQAPGISEEQARLLRVVEAAGYRILDMVNRSLDLFRMESGSYDFAAARVDVVELARRVAEDLDGPARRQGVRFEVGADDAPVVAAAEELLSYSLFANLMKNALEASPTGAVVRVECGLEAGRVRIAVHNAGAVPESLRAGFFRKYASAGKKGGTGLGAYSARLMALTQRGSIEMASSERDGTTVTVWLEPALDAPAATSPQSPVAAPGGPGDGDQSRRAPADHPRLSAARVLLVDDDAPTRAVLARFLAGAAQVEQAGSGEEALVIAPRLLPHVVLIDAEMPGLDGFATAARLRATTRDRMYLLGLSAHGDEPARRAFREAGCDGVLVKPIAGRELVAAVEAALAELGVLAPELPQVEVDADLLPLLPAFLASRREQARELLAALDAGLPELARALAHKLSGGLEMCGFAEAGTLARVLEQALIGGGSAHDVRGHAEALCDRIERLRYRAAPKAGATEGEGA